MEVIPALWLCYSAFLSFQRAVFKPVLHIMLTQLRMQACLSAATQNWSFSATTQQCEACWKWFTFDPCLITLPDSYLWESEWGT